MVGFYRYNPFAPHSTLAESINKISVLLSLSFTCPGKNNLTSGFVCKFPARSFIRLIECLFTAPHAVCILNYFSLPDTANSYFLPRRSSPIEDLLLLVYCFPLTVFIIHEFVYFFHWHISQNTRIRFVYFIHFFVWFISEHKKRSLLLFDFFLIVDFIFFYFAFKN